MDSASEYQMGKEKSRSVLQPNGFHDHLAEWTGLEPATPGVTGRDSNQLNYHSAWCSFRLLLSHQAKCHKLGDPTGIRTPVLTVKG